MVNWQKLAVKSATVIAIALISLVWIFPAQAIERHLELSSEAGYRVETDLAYAQAVKGKISAQGKGETHGIDWLQVRFYNPNGKMIASYDNIVDGIGQGEYFEFNYNQDAQKLEGDLDLGGESAGEMYLKGNLEAGLSLITVEPTGQEKIVDSGAWKLQPFSVK